MISLNWLQKGFVFLLILVTLAALAFNIFTPSRSGPLVSINQVLSDAQDGLIERIVAQGTNGDLLVYYWDNPDKPVRARIERGDSIARLLSSAGVPLNSVEIEVAGTPQTDNVIALLGTVLPFLLIGGLFFFLIRQAQARYQAGNWLKHTWKVDKPTLTFADVGDLGQAKQQVADLIGYLKNPNRFASAGAPLPRAVLLQGPPGTGKTLFAQAVAGEAGVKLLNCNAAEFIELFVGTGAARVRDLFAQAAKLAPVVVVIDQLDAIGRSRSEDKPGTHSETQLLLSQLFTELDQLPARRGVALFAATNRPDLLDPALLRAGRLDRRIEFGLPTRDERLEILKVLLPDKSLGPNVRLEDVADSTEGQTGAELAALVNQAARLALNGDESGKGRAIARRDFEQAQAMARDKA